MRLATLLMVTITLTSLVSARGESNPDPSSVTTRKIFEDGRYNCFTDLIRFRDAYYCTFRSAISHGDPSSGVNGIVVVIRSVDLVDWQEVARLSLPQSDLRDPKLVANSETIRVYAVEGKISSAGILQYQTAAWRSRDGFIWSPPQQMCPGYIFWRPKWHEGKMYVPAYLRRPGYCSVDLLQSDDGENWRLHSTPLPPAVVEEEELWANECDLLFLPEDRSLLFARRNYGGGKMNPKNESLGGFRRGYVGISDATKMASWKSVNEDLYFHCPASLYHQGKIYLAGRDKLELPNGGTTESCKLWEFDLQKGFRELVTFQTRGDSSYPGLIPLNDHELAISYYSCHEGETAYFEKPGKSDIYLTRVKLAD